MQSVVPYTKEIKFNSKISEICSISLEHELNTKAQEISGNFIISGEYKSHEVSVNKEPFSYKLPFQLEMTDTIDQNSLEFEITDFSYEVASDDTLKVDIEFMVKADTIVKEESIEEEANREVIEDIDDLFNEVNVEPIDSENIKNFTEFENFDEETEERDEAENTEIILDSASEKEDEFITYHIHIVKEEDTLESIVATYGSDIDTIKNYNQMDVLNIGDKIIIPSIDE